MSPDVSLAQKASNGTGNGVLPALKESNGTPSLEKSAPTAEDAEDEEGDEDEEENPEGTGTVEKKKSEQFRLVKIFLETHALVPLTEKKKPKKKKKSGTITTAQAMALQSEPPRIAVSTFFKNGVYPIGEIEEYRNENSYRTTSEEKRALERLRLAEDPTSPYNYNSIRHASEVHRQVRAYARKTIKPGMTMTEIANLIEDGTRALVAESGLERGIGFPTGLSRNHCAAHYTPNAGDNTVLKYEDVLKVDIGVHVNGRICDSAFTMNWEPTYDNLLLAVKDATNAGVREAGIDVRTKDIGAVIQEVMESYEVEVNGQLKPVKSIRNLTGHSITPYSIHGGHHGKTVPIVKGKDSDPDVKMEEGEYFAIETFGSTGNGWVRDEGVCSHFAKIDDAPPTPLKMQSAKKLMGTINKQFGTLPFCRRYLDRLGEKGYLLGLNELVQEGLVQAYPPLCDTEGSMTAQFEHTILLRPTCKEIVSRGDDY